MSFYAISLTEIIKDPTVPPLPTQLLCSQRGLIVLFSPPLPITLYRAASFGTLRIVKVFREAQLVSDLSFGPSKGASYYTWPRAGGREGWKGEGEAAAAAGDNKWDHRPSEAFACTD